MTLDLLIVLFAGVSEAIGQSVVLFANRVTPGRFAISLLLNALLVAAGFASLVVCTWLSFFIPGSHPVGLGILTSTIALSYVLLKIGWDPLELPESVRPLFGWASQRWGGLGESVEQEFFPR